MKRKIAFGILTLTAMFGLAGANSVASAGEIKVHFSKQVDNPKLTQVDIDFDFRGLEVGPTTNKDWMDDKTVPLHTSTEEKPGRFLVVKGGNKDNSRKVVYLKTRRDQDIREIFKKFSVEDGKLNTGFSWMVADGQFAIDATILEEKTFTGHFYIPLPIDEVLEPDALGKTFKNGAVTISSSN